MLREVNDAATAAIFQQLNQVGADEETARAIGGSLHQRERELMALYSAGEIEDPATRKAWLEENGLQRYIKPGGTLPTIEEVRGMADIAYRRAARAYEGFQVLIKNSFDTIREAIRNLRLG